MIAKNTQTKENKDNRILALENYCEEIQSKINHIDKIIKELSNKIHRKTKFNRKLNIILTIIITLFLTTSLIIDITLFLTTLISIIPISLIIGVIENKLLTKDRKEIEYYNQKYKEKNHILDKTKNKLERIKQTKTNYVSNNNKASISNNYNLDSCDYFIEKYQLEKRIREITKNKTKKRIRKNSINNLYKI